MGVGLTKLVNFKNIEKKSLRGKIIAIDAYTWLYQFLSSIRQYDGSLLKDSKGRVTSHLSGVFYRNLDLLKEGIIPIWVFDGKPPFFKKKETERRKAVKKLAVEEYKKAIKEEDFLRAQSFAKRTSKLSSEMVSQARELIHAMGISSFDSLSEGEAQAARLVIEGKAYAVGGQDYDTLLFGGKRVVRNLAVNKKKKKNFSMINLETQEVLLSDLLNELGIDRNQLILLGMLIGTDYNSGVKGIGPSKGLKLVKEFKNLEKLKEELNWDEDFLNQIFEFFQNPEVSKNCEIIKQEFNTQKILEILVKDFEFNEKRIQDCINKFIKEKKEKSQQSLNNFT